MENNRRPFSPAIFWLGLGVVLFAVGGKLALIDRVGSDQPYADQWSAEGLYLLRGPLYYSVDFSQMISLHGEHRPALTRFWVRGLIQGNAGQWDCFVELVANLLIYGAFLAVAWSWVVRSTERLGLWFAALFMAVVFALPGINENFLWGFQSCFLFMLLLGFVHVAWTMQEARPGVRWWLAQMAGLLGLFSIAAGAMSAATLLAIAGFELLRGRRNAWVWATLAVNALLFGVGLWLLPDGAGHAGGRLAWLAGAVVRSGYLMAWPFPDLWWGLLLHVPWLWLLFTAWRGKGDPEQRAGDWRVAAVGLWMACTHFAIAYGREITPDTIGGRYFDGLVLGLFVNFMVLLRIHSRLMPGRRLAWTAAGFIWVLSAGWGLWDYNNPDFLVSRFKFHRDQVVEQREILRDFLKTDDPTRLQAFAASSHRFVQLDDTLGFLRDPTIQPLLPPSLTSDGRAGPLSRLAVRIAAGWPILLGAGALLIATGFFRIRRDSALKTPP